MQAVLHSECCRRLVDARRRLDRSVPVTYKRNVVRRKSWR
jgi:hypothetical protein